MNVHDLPTINTRDLPAIKADASHRQRAAANPLTSAWVAASAGTGKTRVLTNRFLRLLLLGEPPESLLALTFTKAAAAEMANRISTELEGWAQSDDTALKQKILTLIDREPSADELSRARLLFTRSLALPQGFNIQTIHSFCGSLLKRFPIEAGLAPDSQQIDEHGAAVLLNEVIESLALNNAPDTAERQALDRMLIRLTPEALNELLAHVVGERARLEDAFTAFGGIDGTLNVLADQLQVPRELIQNASAKEDAMLAVLRPNAQRQQDLTALRDHLRGSNTKAGAKICVAITSLLTETTPDFADYWAGWLNKDGSAPKRPIKDITSDPRIEAIYAAEVTLLQRVIHQLKAIDLITLNRDFLFLASQVIADLQRRKRERNIIDFDDMILLAAKLLGDGQMSGAAQWVQYKLDQGVRHLLVDEAQDTNPDQWRVIQALSEEFFAGDGTTSASGLDRTLFVVGDLKQSIYGFQRADPKLFKRGRERFHEKASMAEKPWIDQPLTTTFRCAPAILDVVNAVFTQPGMAEGLSFDDQEGWAHHTSARASDYGQVVLEPPLIKPKKATAEGWSTAPGDVLALDESLDATEVLASKIAAEIAHWTAQTATEGDDSQWTSADNGDSRRVTPGDILILLKKRGPLADRLIACLQALRVPVAGADRLRLMDQLVIKDLLVLADASLQPEDDLAIATLLRSPLAPIDDALLEDLAHHRAQEGLSLLDALIADGRAKEAIDFLQQCQDMARRLPAYEFFANVLYGRLAYTSTGVERLLARLGNEILDPMHEMLAQARGFERDNPPTVQKFLVWMRNRDESIKRDLEASDSDADKLDPTRPVGGQVRIMTAHASKGLEAPIVILGDAYQKGTQRFASKLIWADETTPALPIWSPSSQDDSELTDSIKERIKREQSLEDRRLLYVAMTRAEERLHIYGMRQDGEAAAEAGWYQMLEKGLDSLVDGQEVLLGALDADTQWRGPRYQFSTGQITSLDAVDLNIQTAVQDRTLNPARPSLPAWATTRPAPEPAPPKPLSPSRLDPESSKTMAAPSPVDHRIKSRFLRGTLIHTLFKMLPDLPPTDWERVARQYLAKPGFGVSANDIESICSTVFNILYDPAHSALFGPNSKAEVPLSGVVDSVPISGQVDRLVEINDPFGQVEEVLVIDYKTNRPPPTTETGVSRLYRLQMTAYGKILNQVYPNARIRPFLLWTDTAHLMELKEWQSIVIPGAIDTSPGQLTLL